MLIKVTDCDQPVTRTPVGPVIGSRRRTPAMKAPPSDRAHIHPFSKLEKAESSIQVQAHTGNKPPRLSFRAECPDHRLTKIRTFGFHNDNKVRHAFSDPGTDRLTARTLFQSSWPTEYRLYREFHDEETVEITRARVMAKLPLEGHKRAAESPFQPPKRATVTGHV